MKNWYLPAPEVSPRDPAHFRLVSKEQTPWDSIKLTFEATGKSYDSLFLSPSLLNFNVYFFPQIYDSEQQLRRT